MCHVIINMHAALESGNDLRLCRWNVDFSIRDRTCYESDRRG
jgi:hypothetical protein